MRNREESPAKRRRTNSAPMASAAAASPKANASTPPFATNATTNFTAGHFADGTAKAESTRGALGMKRNTR